MTPHRWTLNLPDDLPALNLNGRQHWSARARDTAVWRTAAAAAALTADLPALQRAHLLLEATPPDRRRRDRHNLVPALKAATDGLVDAGVLPDDTPDHLLTDGLRLNPPDGTRRWRWRLVVSDGDAGTGGTGGDCCRYEHTGAPPANDTCRPCGDC